MTPFVRIVVDQSFKKSAEAKGSSLQQENGGG